MFQDLLDESPDKYSAISLTERSCFEAPLFISSRTTPYFFCAI